MKRTLCLLLSLMLAAAGFAGLCVPATAADYAVGDVVTFGSYPQSQVTDSILLSSLNAAADGWKSYGYYSSWGSPANGSMTPKDYMQYCDVTLNGQKYRGVQFTQYRPKCTGYSASADNSYQDDNGYAANTVYWFRYEPLRWRVLDAATGLVLCETIIDSQPVNSYALQEGGKYYGNAGKTHYANNYAESSLRAWLNGDFYTTAFTASQQTAITATTLDNSAYSTGFSGFDSAPTTDNVFLLSYKEALNAAYGFSADINASDVARQAKSSDYAKCQGLNVSSDGHAPWWLRSAGYTSSAVCDVHAAGWLLYSCNAYYTYLGVRPALTVDLDAMVMPYRTGEIIEFGSYLQGKLVNEDSIAALEAAAPDFSQWTSYGYYTGTGNNTDGNMKASDYMRYCEITLGDKKYRGVRFTQYRPWMTGHKSTKTASEQDDHGYETETTYWFRYRPLQWRVLDAEKGLLLCESIIDSQPMNSYVLESGTDDYGRTAYWGDADQTNYANNYAQSDLRQWLNNDFLNAAFSPEEQAALTYTTLDNSADENVSRPLYGSAATTDRVFLLSYADAQNAAYGFTDNESLRVKGTGYAKCQGLSVTSSYSPWLLRSPGSGSREVILVNNKGNFITTNYSNVTNFGIRPAITADMNALFNLTHEHTYGEPKWSWADDYSSATATFRCERGDDTQILTDDVIDVTVVSAENCTSDRVVTYTAAVELGGTDYINTTDEVTVPDTALGHEWNLTWTADDTGHWHGCSRCDAVRDQAAHNYGDREYFDADQHVRYCTVCGVPQYEAHDVIVRGAGDATCGSAGYTGDEYCSVCGRKLSEGEVIPPTGSHDFAWVIDTQATCGSAGVKHEECSVCHAKRNENTPIPPTGSHDFAWVTDTQATCGSAGVKHEECAACHTKRNENTPIPPTGSHDFAWVTDTQATCGSAGVKHEECAVCHTKRNENTPIPPTGSHSFAWVTDTQATCGSAGVKHEECAVCHTKRNENTPIPATEDHDYSAVNEKVEATCTEGGYTVYKCSRCGAVDPTHKDVVGKLGHAWGEWEIVQNATPTEKGEKKRTCSRCGETETVEIAQIGELILRSSVDGQTGSALTVTVPYARRGALAATLTANEPVVFTSSDAKLLAVDKDGNVTFTRLNIFRKSATITAVSADGGRTATCTVNIQIKWWQYIVWFLFGSLWF